MKIYLDTCIISGLVKDDIETNQSDALSEILKRNKLGTVELTTSSLSEEEINKIPSEYRQNHSLVYSLLHNIPISNYSYSDSGLMLLGVGGGVKDDPIFAKIKQLLPDELDAKHLFQAIKGGADIFLTVDKKTILKYKYDLEKMYEIKILLPSEFSLV